MARLTAAQRAALPASKFVYPERRAYPIDTAARARNALARVAQSHTSGSPAKVRAAVGRRWGGKIRISGARRPMGTR